MDKCRVAIIGQGRSGRDIHGAYFRSAANSNYKVVAVVERDEARRQRALEEYPGCRVYSDYTQLFECRDIDLAVNSSFSDEHYPITRELLARGFNVLVEKPMARNFFEASMLINTAKKSGALLAVFQQTFLAPFYLKARQVMTSGVLGDIKEVKLRYSGLARRWDWQTLQERMGGGVYNTGPHPLGLAMDFLDFSPDTRVAYSKLDSVMTEGDANDFAKIILVAPGKPVVDVEINNNDAFSPYNLKMLGSKGCYETTITKYRMKYIAYGENEPRPVIYGSLKNPEGLPMYCSESLAAHEEEGELSGTAFEAATESFYEMLFESLANGAELKIKPEDIARLVNIMERIHADNPLPIEYLGGKHV